MAAALTNSAPDTGHLPGLVADIRALREVADVPGTEPTTGSANAGYFSGDNIAEDGEGIDLLIAAGRTDPAARAPGQRYTAEVFADDTARDVWLCPADKVLERQATAPGATGRPSKHRYLASATDCVACPLQAQCLQPGEERRVLVTQRSRSSGSMRFKLREPDARRRYARRKVIVEPIFGQLKEDRGFRVLGLRGVLLARGEWLLVCLAHNLGKLVHVCPLPAAAV